MASGASVLPLSPLSAMAAMAPPLPVLLTPEPAPQTDEYQVPPPLTRQIRETYWEDTETYMRENPQVQECEVLTNNYQWGWVYKVVRASDGSLQRVSKYETSRDFRQPDFKEPDILQ